RLARRVAAVLTHHRHETRVEIGTAVFTALVVSLDTDPRHLATAQKVRAKAGAIRQNLSNLPVGADRRNVVLGIARTHASCASGAASEIDRHRPATLGHAAPVIRVVHALVDGALTSLLALRSVRHRRAHSG